MEMKLEKFTEEMFEINPDDFFKDCQMEDVIFAKSLPFDDKVRFLKYCIKHYITNVYFVVNLKYMIDGCTVDDTFFDEDVCFFNDFEEYLDIKMELTDELNEVETQMCKFFIGCIKGYYSILDSEKVAMNNMYYSLMFNTDMKTISKIMRNCDFNIKDVPMVEDGSEVIKSIVESNTLVLDLLNSFIPQE